MTPLTHAELDEKVMSLFSVGGLYEIVAHNVERVNRPYCEGKPTGVAMPWTLCVCTQPLREGDIVEPCPVHGWVTR